MANWQKIKSSAKRIAKSAIKGTGEAADIASLHIKLKSLEKELGQLSGEALCRAILHLIVVLKADACLGGVGDDEAEIGVFGKRHVCIEIVVGLDATGNGVDYLNVYAFTSAAEVGVFAILCREKVAKSLFNGLNDYCLAVEIGFLVDDLKHPIGKSAQKAALAKLYNLFFHIFSSG